jgi:hypothetical protein
MMTASRTPLSEAKQLGGGKQKQFVVLPNGRKEKEVFAKRSFDGGL